MEVTISAGERSEDLVYIMRGSLVQTNYRLFFMTGQANAASFSVLVVSF